MNYEKRTSSIQSSVELGFQDYAVKTTSQGSTAFVDATPTISGFYAECVRLVNSSRYDAYVKINEKDAFVLFAGGVLNISFDDISKVEIKSAVANKTITVEVDIFGRIDLDI